MQKEDRLPPASDYAEASVIGAILMDGALIAHLGWLNAQMFTHPAYRLTWEAMQSLAQDGTPCDIMTVFDRMDRIAPHSASEYHPLVMQTANATPHSGHARHYAMIVLKKYQQREILHMAEFLAGEAYGEADPEMIGQLGMQKLSRLLALSPDHTTGRKTYGEVLDLLHEDMLHRMDNPDLALRTGFGRIDAWTGGFEPGQLILIAGRPGSGKSAFALSVARRMAAYFHRHKAGVVDVVTMEMSMISQARRLVASRGAPSLDTRLMRQGFRQNDELDEDAYARFIEYLERDRSEVGDALAFHEGVITTDQLAVLASEAKVNHGMQVLVIDQLDLFADTAKGGEYERISNISMKLKQLAMRLKIVIICLVQLNRETERRAGSEKRPQLSDLRQSGRLEQDADAVLALYRPSYYFPVDEEWPDGSKDPYNQWAELLTLKFRDGQADIMTPLCFVGSAASYTDWDAERYPIRSIMDLVAGREKQG